MFVEEKKSVREPDYGSEQSTDAERMVSETCPSRHLTWEFLCIV